MQPDTNRTLTFIEEKNAYDERGTVGSLNALFTSITLCICLSVMCSYMRRVVEVTARACGYMAD